MKPYSHERHELYRVLNRACDQTQELHFFLTRKPEAFRRIAKDARDGKPISASEIESTGRRFKLLATEALRSLAEAHALATVYYPEPSNEEAA